MRICALVKYPPIQGGVSARAFWLARTWAERGHEVYVVTNAAEVEAAYRMWIPPREVRQLETTCQNGGLVRVYQTGDMPRGTRHVPASPAFVTRLASLGTEVVRKHGCQLVFSNYYEPYGISGHLVSTWSRVPHVPMHAGSDRARLMAHPEMGTAYCEMLRQAALVLTADDSLLGFGLDPARVVRLPPSIFTDHMPSWFEAGAPAMDVGAVLRRLSDLRHPAVTNTSPIDMSRPTIGVYGKLGRVKGTYQLIDALRQLRGEAIEFNFLAMVGGLELEEFRAALHDAGIADWTWTLPFMPQWWVPRFLRACTAACFLEHDFPVEQHTPTVPREVLACGVCLILTSEIAAKQRFSAELRHGSNVFLVDLARDGADLTRCLKEVLVDPARAHAVGAEGLKLVGKAGDPDWPGRFWDMVFRVAVDPGRRRAVPRESGLTADGAEPTDEAVLGFVAARMPMTATLLGHLFRSAASSWLAELVAKGLRWTDGTQDLVDRLAAQVEALSLDWRAGEVLRWEALHLWMAAHTESQDPRPALPNFPGPTRSPLSSARPLRSGWMKVVEFRIDVPALARRFEHEGRLSLEQVPEAEQPVVLAFVKRGDLYGRVFRIDPVTRGLVQACDGEKNGTDLALELGIDQEDVTRRLRQLTREGAVVPR